MKTSEKPEVMAPRVGDRVIYWTAHDDGSELLRWVPNPAMVAATHCRRDRGPRRSTNPHDCYLFVVFGPYTGTGGGCGNRYVQADDWVSDFDKLSDGRVTWTLPPEREPLEAV